MQLESLRTNDIGATSVWMPSLGNGTEAMSHLTCLRFSELAFYYSLQQIEQLEHSTVDFGPGNAVQSAVGMWFISIEAYINSIIKIACLIKNSSFENIKTKDFGTRISILFNLLEIDPKPFYRSTFQKLEEFKRYRNELFHDRTNDSPMEFHRTLFSGNPMYANQVDVVQACIISLETYHSFKHVIAGIDLTPQIVVHKNSSFFYAKIDTLYEEVLKPYFTSTLEKHSLSSSLDLEISASMLEESPIFANKEIQIIVKALPSKHIDIRPSLKATSLGNELFEKLRNKVTFDTNLYFKVGDFYR